MYYSDHNTDEESPKKFDDYTDEGIRQHVCEALRNSHIPGEENVEVYVADGVVVLEGAIEERNALMVEELIKGLHHVQGLISNLQPMKIED